jgi:hypothetical protein
MIIHVEGFDQYNNFIITNIKLNNTKIKDLGGWANYYWYKDGIQLENDYCSWKDNDSYEVIFNNDYINLNLKIYNKNIITPLISKKITIKELKNILSIKDNIYFKQFRLKDEDTLEDYSINNMDTLAAVSYTYAVVI